MIDDMDNGNDLEGIHDEPSFFDDLQRQNDDDQFNDRLLDDN